MVRNWRYVVFWLGVAVAALSAWVAWWAVSGFSVPICPEASGKASGKDCLSYDVIRSSVASWVSQAADWSWSAAESANHWAALIAAVFTAVLALYAARLWWSTNKLWNVTNRTLEHSQEASRKELRAYVSVEPLGIGGYIGHNYLVGHFQIRNIGKTPARDVSIYSTIEWDTDGARKNFPIGKMRISPTVVQPGAIMEFASADVWLIPADQLDNDAPLKMKGYLYVWGEVLYTDELKTMGWTAFCHRYPCEMFGMAERELTNGRGANNRSIDRKFARYHEEAGNDAG
jgi:hypothetical protein